VSRLHEFIQYIEANERKSKQFTFASEYIYKIWAQRTRKIICTEHENVQLQREIYVMALMMASLDIVATLQAFPFSSSASLLLHLLGVWQVCHNL